MPNTNTNDMAEETGETQNTARSSRLANVNTAFQNDNQTPTTISGSKGSQSNINSSGSSKKKSDIFPLMKFKKRPISGVLNQDAELSW